MDTILTQGSIYSVILKFDMSSVLTSSSSSYVVSSSSVTLISIFLGRRGARGALASFSGLFFSTSFLLPSSGAGSSSFFSSFSSSFSVSAFCPSFSSSLSFPASSFSSSPSFFSTWAAWKRKVSYTTMINILIYVRI